MDGYEAGVHTSTPGLEHCASRLTARKSSSRRMRQNKMTKGVFFRGLLGKATRAFAASAPGTSGTHVSVWARE